MHLSSKNILKNIFRDRRKGGNLIDDQSTLVCKFLSDGTLTFVNDIFCRYYGKTRDELLGKRYFENVPKGIEEADKQRLAKLTPDNPVSETEHRAINKFGWHRWQHWKTRAIFGKNDELIEYQSIGRDITEQKYVQEALQKSEEKYRNLADNSLVGIYRADLDGNYLYVNEAMAKMFEFESPEEMIREGGKMIYENPEEREKFHNLLKEKGKLTQYEIAGRTKSGKKIYILSNAVLLENERSGMLLDISERKNNENRIQNLTKLYTVLYKVNEAIVRIQEEEPLLQEICEIIAEVAKFPLVWVGKIKGTDILPVASAGGAVEYLKKIKIKTEGELGQGPTGICVQQNKPVINDDFDVNPATAPWRSAAKTYDFRSSAAFPLTKNNKVVGALTIYSNEPAVFDKSQTKLLETLAADISYALEMLQKEKLRHEAEERVLNAKEEWERTFDSVPDLIAILDDKHKIIRVNRAMAEKLKTNSEKCVGLNCYTCVHNTEKPIENCPHAMTLKDGKEHIAEVEEPNLGGTFLVSTTPFFGKDGKLMGSVHVARDITERKEAERKMEDIAKFPLENPNPVLRVAYDGKLSYCNPAASSQFADLHLNINEPAPESLMKSIKSAIKTGAKQEFDMKIGNRFFSFVTAPVADAGYVNIYGMDITARKQADEALIYEKDKLTRILNNMEDGVYISDKNYKVIYANPAFERNFGINFKNQKCFEYLHKRKSPCQWCMLEEISKGKSVRWECYFRKNKKTFDIIETLMATPDGPPTKLAIFRDVTERKKIERTKDDFMSLASHQLRTPLASIGLSSELLLRGIAGALEDGQKDYLEEIYKSTKRMSLLVSNLLNVSRLEMGSLEMKKEPLDISTAVEAALKESDVLIRSKNLKLKKYFEKDIPVVSFSESLFRIVFDNLLANAVRYTPKGGRISLEIAKKGSNVVLKVSDSGCGIPEKQKNKIFEKSFRADNAQEISSEGAGLGLYMVKSIADLAGAKIWFDSRIGKGSNFYFSMPI